MNFKLIKSHDISSLLTKFNLICHEKQIVIDAISTPDKCSKNSLSFYSKEKEIEAQGFVISKKNANIKNATKIESLNPRLDFIKIINEINVSETIISTEKSGIQKSAKISKYADIEPNVSIGKNTIIESFVKIHSGTIIGDNCVIKAGTSIGHNGFGFERDENETPLEFPHFGKVVIGNNVQIGSKCTVCKGALTDTLIKDYVKIDDHCHIAHGCEIGSKTIITAFTTVSGSTKVGEKVYIAPHVAILEKLKIGDGSYIGMASVILKNVPKDVMVFGSPSKIYKKIK